MALRDPIVERTDDQLLASAYRKKYISQSEAFENRPAGEHVIVLALTTDAYIGDNNALLDGLENQIKAISGGGVNIVECKVVTPGPPNGIGTAPSGYQINVRVSTDFDAAETSP